MQSTDHPTISGIPLALRYFRSLTDFLREVWGSIEDDDVFGRSAELGYYFFFSIFPGFIFLSSLPGLLSGAQSPLRASLMQHLATLMPPDAFGLLQQTFNVNHSSGKLTFGALAALWSATVGMAGVCDALNAVHDMKDNRPYWKIRLVALSLTVAAAVLLLCAFLAFFWGDAVVRFGAASRLHWPLVALIKAAQWIVAFFCLALVFAATYFWAPDIKERKWHWITPGASLGIALWILASAALRLYLHFFNSYSLTYGSVGAVMILLIWFYIAGFALLTGAEVNAILEDAAARQGDPTANAKGEPAPQATPELGAARS